MPTIPYDAVLNVARALGAGCAQYRDLSGLRLKPRLSDETDLIAVAVGALTIAAGRPLKILEEREIEPEPKYMHTYDPRKAYTDWMKS
jgi:hypothetical protein